MRSWLALGVCMLLSVYVAACGRAAKHSGQSATREAAATSRVGAVAHVSPLDADNDNDNPSTSHFDADDYFGHLASTRETARAGAVVKRYFAAAAAGDGGRACRLMYALIAETAQEQFGSASDAHGGCAAAMAHQFSKRHAQLAAESSRLKVRGMRVSGGAGWLLIDLGGPYERRMLVHREGAGWKVESVFDIGVP